nr:copia protein [Tanacetum cinerariifolium]
PVSQIEQIFLEELKKLKRQEKEANDAARKETTYENQDANPNSTNLLNDVSTLISTAGPSKALNNSEPSYPDDPSMPYHEDIYASPSEGIFTDSFYDDEGHRQEEGIDYDEVFAPVARKEAIRIFLAFDSNMGFIVYQMDVKSAFLYGTIDEEVYLTQPPGFVDLKFPNKVYKVVKALYGLHQAPRACVKTVSTPIETQKPLVKDEEAADVDVTLKTSHLQAVKRIFRYLKGQPKLGLWYPKVSLFDLEAYSDTDYAGSNLDRDAYEKKLIQVLKIHTKDNVADLLTKAFDVSSKELASPKQTVLGKDKSNPFMAGSLPKATWLSMHHVTEMKYWLFQSKRLLYALMINPTIYVSCIKQFWATVSIKKANDMVKLRALIDGKWVIVIEDVIRQVLCFDDADGVECLPNKEIFTELACMGYEKPPLKLTFYKAFFSAQWKFLIHTLVQCISAKRTEWNEFSCLMASAVICLAISKKFNFSKYICDSMYKSPALTQKVFANMRRVGKGFSGVKTPLFATMLVQPQPPAAEEEDKEEEVPNAPTPPSPTTKPSPPLQEPIPTPPQAQPAPSSSPPQEQPTPTSKSFMTLLNTLIETCATLSQKVDALEQDKIAQALEIFKLKRRFKKLEKKRRSQSSGLKRLRKVGGMTEAIDADEDITLVDVETQDDLEVTMTMAQTLIKMKAEKARLLDEQMAKRLHDEEVEQAAAREKQEKDDFQKAKVLQQQKYQSLKRKPISIAQARKNMIVYLKNMTEYKMEHFKGTNYDKVRPIFKREYNKVQTLFKPDKDEEPTKKRVAEETLLQKSFKKLKAVEVSGSHSTQDTQTDDPKEMSEEDVKNMLEIVLVSEFKVKALQRSSDEDLYKGQSTKEHKFGYILQVIKKLELKKLDDLLAGVDAIQRLEEKALRD